MSVTRPESLADMKEYVLTNLGHPVINVEVAEQQLEVVIYDTIQDMQRYMYGDGVDLVNTTLIVSAGVCEYYVGDSGIEAAFDITLSTGMGGINTLFSPTHMLLYNDWVTNGNYPGGNGMGGFNFGTGALTSYEITGEYMAQANQMFGKQHTVKYDYGKQSLIITPTPMTYMTATLKLYRTTETTRLYNHPLVKKLAVARAQVLWGKQLGKYTVTMPDGSTMNGFEIMRDGKEDAEKWYEEMRNESEPIDFFVG